MNSPCVAARNDRERCAGRLFASDFRLLELDRVVTDYARRFDEGYKM